MRSKKILKNIVSNFLLQAVVVIYGFIVPKIIINCFGSDVNGLVVSISQFLSFIALFESGFGTVVKSVLYEPIARNDKKTIMSIVKASENFFKKLALLFIVYIFVLCCIFPFFVREHFEIIFTISLILAIAVSTFAEYYFGMAYRLLLQAEQKTYVVSAIQIITYVIAIVLALILANVGANIITIELAIGIVFVLRPILQNLYVKKNNDIALKEKVDDYRIRQKWDGLAQHIAWMVHSNTDVVILTLFTNLAEVSVYSVYRLATAAIKKIIQSLNNGVDASFGDMIAKKEKENLMRKFSAYELMFIIIATILYACTLLLITPFVGIYTKGVTDIGYIRPVFGCLLVLGEFIWAVRVPYGSLTQAAGHFKETRKGAWVEAIINIVISMVLVFKFGIIGVAIGTVIAMLIRTIELIRYANKFILHRGIKHSMMKMVISIAIIIASGLISLHASWLLASDTYIIWIVKALVIFLSLSLLIIFLYYLFYRTEMKDIIKMLKNISKKGEREKR